MEESTCPSCGSCWPSHIAESRAPPITGYQALRPKGYPGQTLRAPQPTYQDGSPLRDEPQSIWTGSAPTWILPWIYVERNLQGIEVSPARYLYSDQALTWHGKPALSTRAVGLISSVSCQCLECYERRHPDDTAQAERLRLDELRRQEDRVRREERLLREEAALRNERIRQEERMLMEQEMLEEKRRRRQEQARLDEEYLREEDRPLREDMEGMTQLALVQQRREYLQNARRSIPYQRQAEMITMNLAGNNSCVPNGPDSAFPIPWKTGRLQPDDQNLRVKAARRCSGSELPAQRSGRSQFRDASKGGTKLPE